MIRKVLRVGAIGVLAMTLMGANCQGATATVPSAASDKPPVIKLNALAIGGSAIVEPADVSSETGPTASAKVKPSSVKCNVPRIMISGSASNPGGVQELRIVVRRGTNTIYDVRATEAVGAEGKVPTSIGILGHNKAGAPGSEPLQVSFENKACPQNQTYTIEATAKNFNAQGSTLTETLPSEGISAEGCACE
jgi:hypothetical protein